MPKNYIYYRSLLFETYMRMPQTVKKVNYCSLYNDFAGLENWLLFLWLQPNGKSVWAKQERTGEGSVVDHAMQEETQKLKNHYLLCSWQAIFIQVSGHHLQFL